MEKYESRARNESEALLDELSQRSTQLPRAERAYNIDNCSCPPCGCLSRPWLLPLSPAGIGAAGGIFLATSPL